MPPARPAGVVPVRLAPAVRELLEDGFGADFRAVRVGVRRGGFGPVAYATAERVVIADGWFRPDTPHGRQVLAHEFAHIVQKRLGAAGLPTASTSALETEAHAAAAAVAAGRPFRVRFADASSACRYWGEAGHYYTAYFVMLAAGADNPVAAQMALYAQMPDQVDVLDATFMGKQMVLTIPPPKSAAQMDRWLSPRDIQREFEAAQQREALRQRIQEVQEGIHALTGRNEADETQLRRRVLEATAFPSPAFGVAVHSYGDSFAHRRMNGSGTMYKGPLGHLVHATEFDPKADLSECNRLLDNPYADDGGYFAYLGCRHGKQYMHDPHEPDFIHKRVDLYREYGLTLYDIVCGKLPTAKRLLTREQLQERLDEVSKIGDEKAQMGKLREFAAAMNQPMVDNYRPEEEGKNGPLNWGAYLERHQKESKVPADALQNAQGLAGQWNKLRP